MKFAKKVIIKSQRQFMYGSIFYGSDVTTLMIFFSQSFNTTSIRVYLKSGNTYQNVRKSYFLDLGKSILGLSSKIRENFCIRIMMRNA